MPNSNKFLFKLFKSFKDLSVSFNSMLWICDIFLPLCSTIKLTYKIFQRNFIQIGLDINELTDKLSNPKILRNIECTQRFVF